MRRTLTPWLFAVLVLGLALRAGLALHVAHRPLDGDETSYDEIAWNVATGRGYSWGSGEMARTPTAMRGPGYVLPLALLYRLAGHQKLPMLLVQALLDTISIWLVWRIARRITGRAPPALAAAGIYAVYPPAILSTGGIVTETVVIFTFLAAVAAFLESELGGRPRLAILAPIAVGLCALSKPQLSVVAAMFPLAAPPRGGVPGFLKALLFQVAVVTLVLTPWIARNAVVFHGFVPGITQGGITFWGGSGPDHGHTLGGLGGPGVPPHVREAIRGLPERERDRWFYAEGVRVIRAAPGRYAILELKKIARLWLNLLHERPPSRASLALAAFNLIALLLAVIGARRPTTPAIAVRLLAMLFVYFTLVHMVFTAYVRYAMPCLAYIFCFSTAGAWAWLRVDRVPESARA